MIRFFTFCDLNYIHQAAVMLRSLYAHASEPIESVLYHLDYPASEKMLWWMQGKRLPESIQLDPIWLVECQEERLDAAQANRSYRSYCWSLEPAIVHRQLLDAKDGQILCYVDADSMFFADPIPAIRAVMERADVALSPHHFPPGQEHKERSVGKFNFGAGLFRACDLTRRVVGEWLDQTLAKCDEFGAGDQIYLDQWPAKLGERLAELPRGWNVGPWQLMWSPGLGAVVAHEGRIHESTKTEHGSCGESSPMISYHYHEFRRGTGRNPITLKGESWNRTNYDLDPFTIESVYQPYETELTKFL